MSDERLLEAWRAGDASSGQDLFRTHFDSVYRFFRNKVDARAGDLAEETFLAIVRNHEAARRCSFRADLFAVARDKLIDALRARAPKRVIDPRETSVVDLGASPIDRIDGPREQAQLLSAMRRLPIDLQVLLELRYFEQLSLPELADVLGIDEEEARSLSKRASSLLRAYLGWIGAKEGSSSGSTPSSAPIAVALEDDVERWARDICGRWTTSGS